MLGKFLTFNNFEFPNPVAPSMASKTIENVAQSEAGTDLVVVVRSSKKSWNMSFKLSKAKKDILQALCEDEETTMIYMGTTYTVRVRDFTEKLVEGSEWLSSVDGLYECSVKVTEF